MDEIDRIDYRYFHVNNKPNILYGWVYNENEDGFELYVKNGEYSLQYDRKKKTMSTYYGTDENVIFTECDKDFIDEQIRSGEINY